LIDAKRADDFERAAREEFATNAELLYDKRDRMEGNLIEVDETGKRNAVPLVSLIAETVCDEKVGHLRS